MAKLALSLIVAILVPTSVHAAASCTDVFSDQSNTSKRWPGLPKSFLPKGDAFSIQIRTTIADALVRSGYQSTNVAKLSIVPYGDIGALETLELLTFNPQQPRFNIFNSESRSFWIWTVDEIDANSIIRGRLVIFLDDSTYQVVKQSRIF
jgi:hypothetical protein